MEPRELDYVELDVAIRTDRADVLEVARGVGASAARMGAPLHEVLDRLERSHLPAEPSYELVRQTVLTFVDTLHELQMTHTCEDPLTGWSSLEHLRTVLAGHYRSAHSQDVDLRDTHALVVVEPVKPARNALMASLRAIDIGEALRAVYGGDEVFTRLAVDRFAVLTPRSAIDDLQLRLITTLLRRALGPPEPRLWVEFLPTDEADLDWMLSGLTGSNGRG